MGLIYSTPVITKAPVLSWPGAFFVGHNLTLLSERIIFCAIIFIFAI